MQPDDVASILEKAADLYESETIGWCRNTVFWGRHAPGQLSACAMGALALASEYRTLRESTRTNEDKYPQFHVAVSYLARFIKNSGFYPLELTVAGWNDSVVTTKQDVIQAMKECAKDLRNEQ